MDADLSTAAWSSATRSGNDSSCVEVAFLGNGNVALRDSRHPDGPILIYTAFEWECFVDGVEKGEFDRT